MKDCDVLSQIRDNIESFHPNAICENKHPYGPIIYELQQMITNTFESPLQSAHRGLRSIEH